VDRPPPEDDLFVRWAAPFTDEEKGQIAEACASGSLSTHSPRSEWEPNAQAAFRQVVTEGIIRLWRFEGDEANEVRRRINAESWLVPSPYSKPADRRVPPVVRSETLTPKVLIVAQDPPASRTCGSLFRPTLITWPTTSWSERRAARRRR
jgi:hypothetical protein